MDSVVLDVERLGATQASDSQRTLLAHSSQPAGTLDQLSPPHAEATPRTPADISIAVTSKPPHVWMKGWLAWGGEGSHQTVLLFPGRGHFFNRSSMSPRSILGEMELADLQASLELYEDKS